MSRRFTGFPPEVKELIWERAHGRCERCGEYASDATAHHRRPRALGGSRREDTNLASNGLWACGACHRWAESYRAQAFADGWLVRQTQSPIQIPVLYRGQWVLLDDDGNTYRIPNPCWRQQQWTSHPNNSKRSPTSSSHSPDHRRWRTSS